jgi:hypothetical protein
MPALPETEYRPDEKYQHPQPEDLTGISNEGIPPAPAPVQQEQQKENTKVNISLPTSLVRWVCYTVFFFVVMLPFVLVGNTHMLIVCSVALILGHFAGQLNKLIDK